MKTPLDIAQKLGIQVEIIEERPDFSWDGKCLRMTRTTNLDSELCHELAHWLVAAPSRRKLKEYGLGSSPGAKLFVKATSLQCSQEEVFASLLGIALEAYLFGTEAAERTLLEHSWYAYYDTDDDTFWATIAKLQKKGLLKDHLPTCCL